MTNPGPRPLPKARIRSTSVFDRIPKRRQPFYAGMFAALGFVGACGMSGELYLALVSGQIETSIGPKLHSTRQVILYAIEPTRFGWIVAGRVFMILVLAAVVVAMLRRLFRRDD